MIYVNLQSTIKPHPPSNKKSVHPFLIWSILMFRMPSSNSSIPSAKLLVTFIDDYIHVTWIVLMKEK